MVTWIPSIYPLYVSIYTSTMDPMGFGSLSHVPGHLVVSILKANSATMSKPHGGWWGCGLGPILVGIRPTFGDGSTPTPADIYYIIWICSWIYLCEAAEDEKL
jgi:hypothetical protein